MGIFYTSSQPVLPSIRGAIQNALLTPVPGNATIAAEQAATRTVELAQAVTPKFNSGRVVAALVISGALLWGAIWTAQHNLPDISKALMNSFAGFSGVVLGLLGGEAQKSTSS